MSIVFIGDAQRAHGLVHLKKVRVLNAVAHFPQGAWPESRQIAREVTSTERNHSAELTDRIYSLALEHCLDPSSNRCYAHILVCAATVR